MAERDEVLRTFGELVVAPRDRIFDELADFYAGESADSFRRHVIQSMRSGTFGPEDVAEIVKHYIDRYVVELMYELQDARLNHDCEAALADASGVRILTATSDGLAGDFLTEDGWLRRLSQHSRSRFDPD